MVKSLEDMRARARYLERVKVFVFGEDFDHVVPVFFPFSLYPLSFFYLSAGSHGGTRRRRRDWGLGYNALRFEHVCNSAKLGSEAARLS